MLNDDKNSHIKEIAEELAKEGIYIFHVSEYKQDLTNKYDHKDFKTYIWYESVTSHNEAEKLIYITNKGITNADDYLLKIRADSICDNTRFLRVFLKRRLNLEKTGRTWSLSNHFKSDMFESYLQKLNKNKYNKCKEIPYGFTFLNEPSGFCIKEKFGNIIIISETLKYFLYYMNLFIFGESFGISPQDLISSFMIAIRVMLKTEALDFDLDSRGKLPSDIDNYLTCQVQRQIEFVIGHEYAHHSLGHLKTKNIASCTPEKMLGIKSNKQINYYLKSQKQELEADLHSIKDMKCETEEKNEIVNAAFIFFIALDLYETVNNCISPNNRISTHPPALKRLSELRKKIHNKFGYSTDILNNFIEQMNEFKIFLNTELIPYNFDNFEMYGSIYLPSFREKILIDRVDY
ncbi:MAG TPA: M48 family metalloprotease [Nostocaceae cyanobacterium]|nr:M48 family metalloprotease [Nostocaceae cyanobacterium]